MNACDSTKTLETLKILMVHTAMNVIQEQMTNIQALLDHYVGDADRQTIEDLAAQASETGDEAWAPERYWEGAAFCLANQLQGPAKHTEELARQ